MDSDHKYSRLERSDTEEKRDDVKTVEYQYKISNMDAFWNTCSSIQGLGVLAMPLAASYGGYWFILATIAVATLSCYTSKILVQCLYEVHLTKGHVRVRNTYAEVGEAFWPQGGRNMVLIAKFLELMFSASSNPIACAEAMSFLCPGLNISTRMWILVFGAGMIGNIFLTSITLLSKISMVTIVLGFATFGTVIGYCIHEIPVWNINDLLVFQPSKFPLSLGMLTASYSAQIYLAVLEVSMRSPEKFNSILNYGYVIMTLLKIVLGVCGFLAFSTDVQEVITNNLPRYFLVPMNIIVIFLSFSGYSLPIYAVYDMIESSSDKLLGTRCLNEYGTRPNPFCKYLLRLTVVLTTVVMAATVPYFALILAFVGSVVGTSIAIIFPCLFHIKIHWEYLEWHQIVLDALVALFGVMISVFGLTYSIIDFIEITS